MAITRRDFLKYSAATGAGVLFGVFDLKPIVAYALAGAPVWTTETTSICCFCGVGCGVIVGAKSTAPYVTYVQGDPDHPINKGSLCSKGSSLAQLRTVDGALNPKRLTKVKYRRPGGTDWEEYSWSDTIITHDGSGTVLDLIVKRIRDTREEHTVTEELIDDVYTPVNRCTGIANLGGAALDNEECYLLSKLMRSLGVVYLEHQARI
jgi:formate dehydrogenase major subunit